MFSIFHSADTHPVGEAFASGSMPGEGTYFCLVCGTQLSLRETDEMPECTYCGATRFRRDSIFSSRQDHGSPTVEFALPTGQDPPPWVAEAEEGLTEPGYHLAMRERSEIVTFHLGGDWTRIGRCNSADVCLDDPSVSRRHAILATNDGERLRALDDRSLNGVFVNGRKIDLAELEPGDELAIGRYRLYLLHA